MDRQVSIRVRVIAAVVLLAGLALALSGIVVYVQSQASLQARVSETLEREAEELSLLSQELDPATGEPYEDVETFLTTALLAEVYPSNEGSFGVVAGSVEWTGPDTARFHPEKDPELVEKTVPLTTASSPIFGSATTSLSDYRYVVVPVSVAGGTSIGALVHVVDLAAERAVIAPIFTTYSLIAGGSLALVALLIWLLVGRLLLPIRTMRETAERITETDISQRVPVSGTDDLSALGNTINGMLGRLENAVTGQRQLLDDVGHELRTPLTIVRGHLELMNTADPEDVQSSRALVIDELDRMRRLVEDLLTLAKSEQRDFVIPTPTDVAHLTDETLVKATRLGARRWVLEGLADIEAPVDPQRISQALLQLAENAVSYSPADSPIGMGSAIADGELRFWVSDRGPGIAADERERILERSTKGRSGTGTGLGLAIVSSIARAHGGRVEIDDGEDGGTRVTLVVPVRGEETT